MCGITIDLIAYLRRIIPAFGAGPRAVVVWSMLHAALCCGFVHLVWAEAPAASPPMGWNSWDAYGFTIDEAAYKENAAVLAQLKGLGWRYAVIDEGWYMKKPFGTTLEEREYQLNQHGLLIPDSIRFASAVDGAGLRPLAEWTHRLGLKLGIHIVRGIPKAAVRANSRIADSRFRASDAADLAETCPWDDGNYGVRDNSAGQAYYDSMFTLYAFWRIDFVKVDCIANAPYRPSEIRQIATAIRRAGRPMVLSLSPGPTNISHAEEIGRFAQMWRISNDIWDGWSFEHSDPKVDFPTGIVAGFDKLALWSAHARPGHWPDADMLPFGMLTPHPGWGEPRASRLTTEEQQTQFVLWTIARSPLILGANLTKLDERTRSLITNRGLIDVNQGDWTSHPLADLPEGYGNVRVWIATQSHARKGDRIVALFNLGSEPTTIRQPWKSLGLQSPRTAVFNVLTGERVATDEPVEVRLAAHASAVYRLH